MKKDCLLCGGRVRSDSKDGLCTKCKAVCPKCGGRKDLHSRVCSVCRCNDKDAQIRASLTWYLSDDEKDIQMERIRGGHCKFGCGQSARYPASAGVKVRCCESASQCPIVASRSARGLKSHWDSLSKKERGKRSELATEKAIRWSQTRTPSEKKSQMEKRSQNMEWRRKLSESRKRLIEKDFLGL